MKKSIFKDWSICYWVDYSNREDCLDVEDITKGQYLTETYIEPVIEEIVEEIVEEIIEETAEIPVEETAEETTNKAIETKSVN